MKKYINLTPHVIILNDGTNIPASGAIARISSSYTEFDDDKIAELKLTDITGLPDSAEDTVYVVSGLVAQAAKRQDVVSPATGHPDAKRDDRGQIVSVPGFVRS